MDADRWARVEEIFAAASELPPAERAALLARACGDDADLRREVESLLAADARAGEFLDRPAVPTPPVPPLAPFVGRTIGHFRIEKELGEGGMSTVYLAVRSDDVYQQRVALKILDAGAERSGLAARFRAERQILASLDHPGIARLLDGGTTEDGRPYLVLEYIEGVPIDRYCDQRTLSVEDRIDLFRQVCAAVQFAHQNLIVHRDIKPSNILVAADGVPRLLDFGIAKLLEGARVPGGAEATRTGQQLMTPQYASPEQLAGGPVTTATDIYSLGVLLYVLLTGHLPYRLLGDDPDSLRRAVAELNPERPSTAVGRPVASAPRRPSERLASDGPGQDGASAARGLRPGQLRRKLRGDLDNIVLTALRKEPERRYATVGELAEDLRRYREHLPVAAQPDRLAYRARKFVDRHTAGVVVAAAGLALVTGLAVTMTVQAVSLGRQRDEIRAERDKAVRLTHFLENVFASSDPGVSRGETLTAREILDQGSARAMAELEDQPEIRADLALIMGRVYERLGLSDRAQPLLDQSLALRRQLFGEDSLPVAESLLALAALEQDRGEFEAAETGQRHALAIRRARLGTADPRIADALQDLSTTLLFRGHYGEAETTAREALEIHRASANDTESRQNVAVDLANLGSALRKLGRLPESEAAHREAVAIGRRVFGPVHPKLSREINNLAVVLVDEGRFAEAESLAREALGITRKLYGPEHPDVALQLSNLSSILRARGDFDGAIATAREALAMRRRIFGPRHEQVAMSLSNLGDFLEENGDLASARPLFDEALSIDREVFGAAHPRCAVVMTHLAELALARGDLEEAESRARQALAIRLRALGAEHPDSGEAMSILGAIRQAAGAGGEAEPLLRRGLEILERSLPAGHWRIAEAESRLGACLADRGKPREAEPMLVAGFEDLLRTRGARSAKTAEAMRRVAAFYVAQGNRTRANTFRARLAP